MNNHTQATHSDMQQSKKSWTSALKAFADRRALMMLFLGFSSGFPYYLIVSTLTLWLGEAGIERSAITFFAWAALGYSFKFIWAPLIDEVPLPVLTQRFGRRRAWLLVAQAMIILSICLMAMTDPSMGQFALYQMAVGAVLLGFSSATQDIVIDAYRIELAEQEMQSVLASTFMAGYRIGLILTGAGALFLASYFGTSKSNYIYSAWQYTYLLMAGIMFMVMFITLKLPNAEVIKKDKPYTKQDYLRLFALFSLSVTAFVLLYSSFYQPVKYLKDAYAIKDSLTIFAMESVRFLSAGGLAVIVGIILVKIGLVQSQVAYDTWVAPIADFFKRYGLKLALIMLLLIGFFRISDIVAGTISNTFYQDLNFTKEQIATAVKTYGVIFSLIGGFLGGLLAQRFNVMKLLFIAAICASCTNLIFIGLVKSGQKLADVQVNVAGQIYTTKADDVGYWSVKIPQQQLQNAQSLQISTHFAHQNAEQAVQYQLPYLKQQDSQKIHFLPISQDNQLYADELKQPMMISGQFFGVPVEQLDKNTPIKVLLDGQEYPAKIDKQGKFSVTIHGEKLHQGQQKILTVIATHQQQQWQATQSYQTFTTPQKLALSMDVQPLALVDSQQQSDIEVKGKAIQYYSSWWLYFAIVVDNLASGLAGAAFIAFLSSLTSVSFTAVQYALFSSLMTLAPKFLGGYSGTMVTAMGYPNFFLMTTLIGIPILVLVVWVGYLLKRHEHHSTQQHSQHDGE